MTEPFDIRQPLPDLAHEALRVGLLEVVDDLAVQVQRMAGVLLLLDTTSDFAQGTLNTARSARETLGAVQTGMAGLAQGGAALQSAVADLAQDVAALKQPTAPEPEPDPQPGGDDPGEPPTPAPTPDPEA